MKKIASLILSIVIISSCEKEPSTTQNTNNNSPTPNTTCCPAPFVSTSTISTNPDSIYSSLGFSSNNWIQWYVIISSDSNSDTLWTNGYESYENNPSNNTDTCLIFREFGNIIGMVDETGNHFQGASFAIYLPLDSNQVLNFPKGRYGFEKYYGASFNNDIGPKCKGAIHLQYAVNNQLYRALPQNSTSTYYNEIQEIKFIGYNNANKIYSIKGEATVLMENQVDLSTAPINLKYRILVEYNS